MKNFTNQSRETLGMCLVIAFNDLAKKSRDRIHTDKKLSVNNCLSMLYEKCDFIFYGILKECLVILLAKKCALLASHKKSKIKEFTGNVNLIVIIHFG
jgi:hypothetical protein